jgi:hypothetical protein
MIAYFVWLPYSGRYVIREDQPLAPMRRDERSKAIRNKAATWGFAVETVLVAMGAVWGTVSGRHEPTTVLGLVLVAGTLTYRVAQGWVARRT